MQKKLSVDPDLVFKNIFKALAKPWIVRSVFNLEKEKLLFDFLNKNPESGIARGLQHLSIRITDACNLRCHICGQWGDNGYLRNSNLRKLKEKELSPQRYFTLLDDLAAHNKRPIVFIWGGEPMLYKGVLDVAEHATKLRMPVAVNTNCTGLEKAAERLTAMPLFLLQISIDGHNAATHNMARPSAGGGDNFRDVQQGLSKIKEEKARLKTKLPLTAAIVTISTANADNIVDIYEAFRKDVDIYVFCLSWWIDEKNAQAHEADFSRRFGYAPTTHKGFLNNFLPQDYDNLARQLQEIKQRSAPFSEPAVNILPNITSRDDLCAYFTDHGGSFGIKRCLSIFQSVSLDANGNMSPCRDYHDYIVGNAEEETLTAIWNNEAFRKFRSSLTRDGLMPVCTRCCQLVGQ